MCHFSVIGTLFQNKAIINSHLTSHFQTDKQTKNQIHKTGLIKLKHVHMYKK